MKRRTSSLSRAAFVLLAGTAGCARYVPGTLDPAAAPAAYAQRTLAAAALRDSIRGYLPAGADDRSTAGLAIAALLLHGDVAAATADVRAARAAIPVAARRPAPGADVQVERLVYGVSQGAPWAVGLAPVFRLEFGGKRAARTALAAADASIAEMRARGVAAVVVADVRRAALARDAAIARLRAATSLAAAQAALVAALEERERAGEIGTAELVRARQDLADLQLVVLQRRRERAEADAAVGRAVQVPPAVGPDSTAAAASVLVDADTACPATPDARAVVRATALRARYDIGLALAEYARADAEVRVQVAAAAPDLSLAPGFLWDQGTNRWTLGAGLPEIRLDRNRAGIAAAVARREAEAARVAAVQAAVLAETDAALAACSAAVGGLPTARGSAERAKEARRLAVQRWSRGEAGARDTLYAAVAEERARLGVLEEELRAAEAVLAVDVAANRWTIGTAPSRWPFLGITPPETTVTPPGGLK